MSVAKKINKPALCANNQQPWLTVALSTTARKNHLLQEFLLDLQQQSDLDFELLIVIQSSNVMAIEEIKTKVSEANLPFAVSTIVSDRKGLLVSRNIALGEARGRYILLADDDCRFFPTAIDNIKTKTKSCIDSEILTFQAVTPEGDLLNPRNNPDSDESHNLRTVMSVCSIEIVVSRSLVKRTKNLFDERFGLGTPFNTGGENIMLVDSLRTGVKITRHPAPIVEHPASSSGLGSGGMFQLAFAKGAMFRRMFGVTGLVFLIGFMLRGTLLGRPPRFMPKHYWSGISGFLRAPATKKGVTIK